MGALFGRQEAPEIQKPRVTRMPAENDPSILAAAERAKEASRRRRGRLSTIMTDTLQDRTGSSGQYLGA